MENPDYQQMVDALIFDPRTGYIWRKNSKRTGPDGRAGTVSKERGYRGILVGTRVRKAHRLMWFFVHREWPETIDHINGDKDDNRISNLRKATISENIRNRTAQANNTSGYKGVTFHKRQRKWAAKIGYDKRRIHLGYFDTPKQAYAAYCGAAIEYHGEFARVA